MLFHIVDIFDDKILLSGVDSLFQSAHIPLIDIYSHLHDNGFKPSNEISTLIYSICVFIFRYNIYRNKNNIEDSIKLSYNFVLHTKIVSNYLASKTVFTIDKVAGVE